MKNLAYHTARTTGLDGEHRTFITLDVGETAVRQALRDYANYVAGENPQIALELIEFLDGFDNTGQEIRICGTCQHWGVSRFSPNVGSCHKKLVVETPNMNSGSVGYCEISFYCPGWSKK